MTSLINLVRLFYSTEIFGDDVFVHAPIFFEKYLNFWDFLCVPNLTYYAKIVDNYDKM